MIVISVFLAIFSVFGVSMPREIFFEEEDGQSSDSCSLWHVKASYITAAVGIPALVVLAKLLPEPIKPGDSDTDAPDGEGQEMPALGRHSEAETVATDESDLRLDENLPSLTLPSIT